MIAAGHAAEVAQSRRRQWLPLALLLAASLLIRLPFITPGIGGGDAQNYAFGSLTHNFVAHPPGYCGFVFLGWLLDQATGNISTAYVILSECGALAAIATLYFLARAMRLAPGLALLAAAGYSASVNLLEASGVALPFALEGFLATLFALLAWRAIRDHSAPLALAATLVWAAAGAIRPTTTAFLLPLWLYLLWHFRRTWMRTAAMAFLGLIIVAAWSRTNSYLLAHATFATPGRAAATFLLQVYMPANHEYAVFGPVIPNPGGLNHPTYHMPAVEAFAWLEDQLGLRILPRVTGLPPPSLRRAATLATLQLSKLTMYFVLAAPLIIAAAALKLLRRPVARPGRPETRFLAMWILPATLFFLGGHLGSAPYLEVFLGGVFILVTCLACAAPAMHDNAADLRLCPARLWLLLLPALFLGFFLFGRPLPSTGTRNRLLNVALLGHTGWSVHHYGLSISRNTNGAADPALPRTDAELLELWRQNHFSPVPETGELTPSTTAPATGSAGPS